MLVCIDSLDTRYTDVLKLAVLSFSILVALGTGAATDLNNIESITPSGSNPIDITGELSMNGNNIDNIGSITSYYGSSCNTGNTMVNVNGDGSFDCVDVTGEVQGDFVDRNGDTMTGNLDLQQNYLTITNNDGDYYLGGGNTPDAETTGVHLEAESNPNDGEAIFVVESSGGSERLRVEHSGETTTSNDFDATGFTESGSGTLTNDITGDADTLDGNDGSYYLDNTDNQQLSISGDTISLDNGGSVTIQDDYDPNTDNQQLSMSGDTISLENGGSVTINQETIADNQNLQSSRSGDTVTIDIDNGNGASFTDNFEANTDNQQLSISGDTISLDNGGSVTIQDDYDPNTDASTECSGNDYLAGDGSCNGDSYDPNTDNQDLSNVVNEGNSLDSRLTLDTSNAAFRLPVGSNAY